MHARAIAPAALICALALTAGTAAAQSFHYTPGTNQYRMSVDAKITQTVMGQANETGVSSVQKFTMALAKQSADTLSMTVTIDSLTQDTPMGPTPGLDSLIGKPVKALLAPDGKFYASASPESAGNAALSSVADPLIHMLPRIRVAMVAGATWTDTTSATTAQMGLELKRQVISTYTVAGDTTVGGKTAWKINRASTSTTSGGGNIQGQNASMTGTSTGTGVVVLSHDGVFMGDIGQETVKATLSLTDAGVSYDIGTVAKTTIDWVN